MKGWLKYMKYRLCSAALLSLCMFLHQPVYAEVTTNFPTHCKTNKYVHLNARMGSDETDVNGHYLNKKNKKILSICTDKDKEPFSSVIYRYGEIGNIELEKTATATNRFYFYESVTDPHAGEDIIFFKNNGYTYYVSKATGQENGVSLIVYKSKKLMLNLFSGTGYGSDFEYGVAEINVYKNSSVFYIKTPPLNN